MSGTAHPPPPMFAASSGGAQTSAVPTELLHSRNARTVDVDQMFSDCFVTPDGDTIFLSEQDAALQKQLVESAEADPTVMASKYDITKGNFVEVEQGGGIETTNLDKTGKASLVMGAAAAGSKKPERRVKPQRQRRHHMPFVTPGALEEQKEATGDKKERKSRSREQAKKSRERKKFLLESLQQSVALLKDENEKLRQAITATLGAEKANALLNQQEGDGEEGLIAAGSLDANKVLDDPDFSFIKAIQTAQQNFVVTDPSLPDNPIVYATQGFMTLTGYSLDQILGRNCRFLQGPETDPKAVDKIRNSIENGTDMSVCLLNYRADGTTFWNQFFIAALRDASGKITNYVGVQCKVSDQYAANACKNQDDGEAEG